MEECKECGKEISKKAKKCPNCGVDTRNWFMRHKILSAIGIFVILVIVGSIGGGDDNTESPTSTDTSVSEEPSQEDEVDIIDDQEFAVGEPVEAEGQVVEVTQIEKSQGNNYDKPSSGKEFVVAHVNIQNNGDGEISYNPFNFKMQNSDGQIESQGFTIVDSDTKLSSGNLASGGNVSGTIAFEQPIDDPGLQLIFEPNFWGNTKIKFNLSE